MQILIDIWQSFRRMPTWVQIWVALILMPVNLAALAFLAEPNGGWIATIAVLGMAWNMPFLFGQRGFGKVMALPHVVLWTPAVLLALATLTSGAISAGFATFLIIFVIVDVISLAFDYKDSIDWYRGDRAIA